MQQTANTQQRIAVLFLLTTAATFVSSIINWVASNWQNFTRFEKLYAMQGLVALCVAGTVYSFYQARQSQQNATYRHKLAAAFFCLAMSFGALFALLGQSYQTGADAWQLFAIWALVQLPLLWLVPNVASAILLMVTLNLALHFFTLEWFNRDLNLLFLLCLNALFVFADEAITEKWNLPHRLLARAANVLLICSALFSFLSTPIFSPFDFIYLLAFCSTVGLVFYHLFKQDHLLSTLYFIPFIIFANCVLVYTGEVAGILLTVPFSFAAVIIFLRKTLNELKANNQIDKQWLMVLPLLISVLVIAALIVLLSFIMGEGETDFAVQSAIALIIALSILGGKNYENEHSLSYIIANLLLGVAQVLACVFVGLLDLASTSWLLAAALCFHIVIYVLPTTTWLRTASWCVLFQVIQMTIMQNQDPLFSLSLSLLVWLAQVLGSLLIFTLVKDSNTKQTALWQPFAWASVLFIFAQSLPFGLYGWEVDRGFTTVETLSQKSFFQVIFGVKFSIPLWRQGFVWLLASAPFFTLWWGVKKHPEFSAKKRKAILLIGLLLSFWLLPQTTFAFTFCLLLIALFKQQRMLLAISAVFALWNLWHFYYTSNFPFLYKSLYMLVLSAIVLFGYLVFRTPHLQNREEKRPLAGKDWGKMVALVVFSLGVFGAVWQKMQQYETVLNEGKPVILALAPVDPRSLMQGDYMVLDYAISREIRTNAQFNALKEAQEHFAYALLREDENGVAHLAELNTALPAESLALPIRFTQDKLRLPSEDFFFPEGKGEHYAQARYAEYRIHNGVALLSRLLDEKMKPL